MFANELSLAGEGAVTEDIQVVKTGVDREGLADVLVNGRPTSVGWDADVLMAPVTLRSGEYSTVRVVHHNRFSGSDTRLGAMYRFKAAMRRSLCDIRDNYVDIARHRLRRFSPSLLRSSEQPVSGS